MSKTEWKEYKLGEVCSISSSKRIFANEYTSSGIPFYRGKEIIQKHEKKKVSSDLFISETRYNEIKSKFPVPSIGDILLTSVGTLGVPWLVDEEKFYFKDGNLTWFRVNKDYIDSSFLYYWLESDFAKNQIDAKCIGSTQKALTIDTLEKFTISLPTLAEQQRIAKILSSLDDEIELNNAINRNLEEQVNSIIYEKALLNESCPKVKLGDYLYIKGRIGWKGLKKNEYLDVSDYRIINGESLTESGVDWAKAGYISKARYDESPEIMLKTGDIMLSKDGTIGKIGYIDSLEQPTSVASGIFVIRNQQPRNISTAFIYFLLKSQLFKDFIEQRVEGSVIPHLYQKDFMDFVFSLPVPQEMKKINDVIQPMFEKIIANLNENKNLVQERGVLLSKLMLFGTAH